MRLRVGRRCSTGQRCSNDAATSLAPRWLHYPHVLACPKTASHYSRTTPHGATPHCTTPHCTTPHCTTPHGATPHRTTPHCTTQHGATPHRTTTHCTTPHGATAHGAPAHGATAHGARAAAYLAPPSPPRLDLAKSAARSARATAPCSACAQRCLHRPACLIRKPRLPNVGGAPS